MIASCKEVWNPERSEYGVRVHPEYGGEVTCRREALAWLRLAVRDGATDLGSHLLVESQSLRDVDLLDRVHDAMYHSIKGK